MMYPSVRLTVAALTAALCFWQRYRRNHPDGRWIIVSASEGHSGLLPPPKPSDLRSVRGNKIRHKKPTNSRDGEGWSSYARALSRLVLPAQVCSTLDGLGIDWGIRDTKHALGNACYLILASTLPSISERVTRRVVAFFTPKSKRFRVQIPPADPAYEWIQMYLSRRNDSFVQSYILRTIPEGSRVSHNASIHLLPDTSQWISVGPDDNRIHISRKRPPNPGTFDSSLEPFELRGISRESLRSFVHKVKRLAQRVRHDHTNYYRLATNQHKQIGWQHVTSKRRRYLSSLVLHNSTGDRLLEDMHQFLASEAWYRDRGLPYRRGYLLHGPPGCGKTSLIQSLAGELQLDVYILNLASPGITDESLTWSLSMDKPGILVVEDIDATFSGDPMFEHSESGDIPRNFEIRGSVGVFPPSEMRDDSHLRGRSGIPHGVRRRAMADGARVTFSGLLNALDGLASSEGRILIMTTNHISTLDSALIRPGRVDWIEHLPRASRSMLQGMFLKFFPGEYSSAEIFADSMPVGHMSMASVQAFLMEHRQSPEIAARAALATAPSVPPPNIPYSQPPRDTHGWRDTQDFPTTPGAPMQMAVPPPHKKIRLPNMTPLPPPHAFGTQEGSGSKVMHIGVDMSGPDARHNLTSKSILAGILLLREAQKTASMSCSGDHRRGKSISPVKAEATPVM